MDRKMFCTGFLLATLIFSKVEAQISWTGKTNVFVGDSNTEGVHYNDNIGALDNYGNNRFSSALSAMKGSLEDNRGIRGKVVQDAETACNTTKASESFIPEKTVNHLFLYIKLGSNDIAHHNGSFVPSAFQTRLNELIDDALAKGWPSTSIVLMTPPWAPVGSSNEPFDKHVTGAYDTFYDYCGITDRIDEVRQQSYVDAVQAVANQKSVVFIDLYAAMKNHPDRLNLLSTSNSGYDRIHLNTAGHQFVANLLANFPYPEALPLNLIDFSVQRKNNTVHLQWTSENEVNTKEFIIERSDNRQQFKEIGMVSAHGNSASQQFYQFTDVQPTDGNNLYRLKMVDIDGNYEYSKNALVNINSKTSYSVSPNPAKGTVTITTNGAEPVLLQIIDITGRVVKAENLSGSLHTINIQNFKKGLYLIRINAKDKILTEKFIVD